MKSFALASLMLLGISAAVAAPPSGISMKAVSPLADFSYDYQDLSFTPVAQKSKSE